MLPIFVHSFTLDEFKFDRRWNDLLLMGLAEKTADRFAPLSAVVEREVVHVHADEAVGAAGIETPRKLHRIGQRFITMIEGVLNAFLNVLRNTLDRFFSEIALDDVAAKRQR